LTIIMDPKKSFLSTKFSFLLIFFLITISLCELNALSSEEQSVKSHKGPVVKREQRRTLFETEYGEISATDVKEGHNKTPNYHIQFFTLEPNSVFLPVLLHAAMVFYVHTGRCTLWIYKNVLLTKIVYHNTLLY
jgi:hypothetical protein